MKTTRTGARTLFTLYCARTGESSAICVCHAHAKEMPAVDGDRVRADAADDDCSCDFCEAAATFEARAAAKAERVWSAACHAWVR